MPLRRTVRHLNRARLGALVIAAPACLALAACGHSGKSNPPNLTSVASQSTGVETAEPSSGPETSGASDSVDGSAAPSGTRRNSIGRTPRPGNGDTNGSNPSSTGTDSTRPQSPSSSATSEAGKTSVPGATYTAAAWSQFTTPTGKNWCDLIPNEYVGCHLSPALQAQHDGNPYIMLDSSGVKFMTGDPGMNLDGIASAWARGADLKTINGTTALPYGSSLKGGSITCSSSPYGFTCGNGVASFTVSSTQVTTTGKVA